MTAPQTVADVLDAAADLLEKPKGWTQKTSARDFKGREVPASSPSATCFCVMGAIARVVGDNSSVRQSEARDRLRPLLPTFYISDWNDAPGRTQSEVVAALRAAATSARQGETK